ncbi:MAG: efflux RND transporter permease subunit [Thermoguttaceae bacterium]
MNFAHFFITRPVFSCVVALLILLAGVVAAFKLPVELFPNVIPPTVYIFANYPGASAETLSNTVAAPIEKSINSVEQMTYVSTTCTSAGDMRMIVTFELEADPDLAVIHIQNRINNVLPQLPHEVVRGGITVEKNSMFTLLLVNFFSPADAKEFQDRKHIPLDERRETSLYLTNVATLNVKRELERVAGVGKVEVYNNEDFSMRVWLYPELLAARSVSVNEVVAALEGQNVQVAAGRVGQSPASSGTGQEVELSVIGRLRTTEEFGDIVIRNENGVHTLRLRDIARIELGSLGYQTAAGMDGIPCSTLAIYPSVGANAIETADGVTKCLESLRKRGMFGDEIDYKVAFDYTNFVRTALKEVVVTLVVCIVVVVFVVWIFLQDFWAVLIPTITIPVSLVGTFFLMWFCGCSVNTFTLFGLILAIGIVVDDAIIVIENMRRHIDDLGESPRDAALKTMQEVTGPIVATTLVLLAIFVPTAMVPGIVGEIYRQFALTIAGAVCISAVCAVTFSPALAALFLKPASKSQTWFSRGFNRCFDIYARVYLRTLKGVVAVRGLVLVLWFVLLAAIYFALNEMPKGFIPDEDTGTIYMGVTLPQGATLERTQTTLEQLQQLIDADRTGIANTTYIAGWSPTQSAYAENAAFVEITLTDWDERYPSLWQRLVSRAKTITIDDVISRIQSQCKTIPDAEVMLYPMATLDGLGTINGLEYQLQALGSSGVDDLYAAAEQLCEDAMKSGLFSDVQTPMSPFSPRIDIDINREKAMQLGVSLPSVFGTLEGVFGARHISEINLYDAVFTVFLQSDHTWRSRDDLLLQTMCKNSSGEMVPLGSFATLRRSVGPQFINRHQLHLCAPVLALLAGGVSTGDGIAKLEQLSHTLPEGFTYSWTGTAWQEIHGGNTMRIVLVMSILFAVLILCAQYESWIVPLVIVMAVPLGIGGALLGAYLRGLDINIFTQVGFILMVGLSAKNAILITEFAVSRYRSGASLTDAALDAGRLRLRPIMMTSFAFIVGVVPLILATGAGAASRHAIGTPICFGMLTETLVGIYVTPILFILLCGKLIRRKKPEPKSEVPESEHEA